MSQVPLQKSGRIHVSEEDDRYSSFQTQIVGGMPVRFSEFDAGRLTLE